MDARTTDTTPVKGLALLPDTSWVLTPLLAVDGVKDGVVFTRDGMAIGSSDMDRETKDARAVLSSQLLAAGRALIRECTGGDGAGDVMVTNTDGDTMYVVPAGETAALQVSGRNIKNLGHLAYQAHVQVAKLAEYLADASHKRTTDGPQ
ncbi:roadblock/LC7 domain-containing protein [Streptomyces sp. FXJ1.4098]|nr:roadblock/LC7 domain-containing protein [Streptomyces sp. FXJ1.4098]